MLTLIQEASVIDQFKCDTCRKYLTPPITQCLDGHISCQRCWINTKCPKCNASFIPAMHKGYGKIAREILFPCTFQPNGCYESFHWTDIAVHERECEYRNFECPIEESCSWNDAKHRLKDHVFLVHENSSLIAANSTTTFKLDMSSSRKVFLISSLECVFMLRINRKVGVNYTEAIIQFVEPEQGVKKYDFKLEVMTADGRHVYGFHGRIESETEKNVILISDFQVGNLSESRFKFTILPRRANKKNMELMTVTQRMKQIQRIAGWLIFGRQI